MANLASIFGGAFSPEPCKRVDPPEVQLSDAIQAAGLEPPEQIHIDGKLHRFRTGTRGRGGHGDKSGWYVAYPDGVPAGRFGCWREGLDTSWRADIGRPLDADELMAHQRRMEEAKAARDAELEKSREMAAVVVERIWSQAQAASADHPYLARKGIKAHGARVTADGRLVVPLYDADGTLASLQYIDHAGGKLYHPGGQTGGKFWMVGTTDTPGPIYVAEGFATAATIHQATNRPCVVSYSASNLVGATQAMRERFGVTQDIVIVADHDRHGVGQRYAEQASAKFGARVVVPPIEGMDANDYQQAGHDLGALLNPPSDDGWLIPADEFSAQPAPIAWLVKGWLQAQALIMVHGPSGGGKTFAVLDWCLRMASETSEWAGCRVKPGSVVYLAGEGHHGLRGRVAAWKHKHRSKKLSMWLSRDGCDLNTPEGFRRTVTAIRQAGITPALIVVDTLHRFLSGDENSAQDAKTMLDACNALMREFDCSVLLVHHTGVSEEAQHRARGSSAWRGALDIEISVVPTKDDKPMQLTQRKSKDAELARDVYARLESVAIPGWLDEDGEQVTSAVLCVVSENDLPTIDSKPSKHDEAVRTLERAWWASGCEDRGGLPYLSRSALRELLVKDGASERTAKNNTEASRPGGLIAKMLNAGILESCEHGWLFVNEAQASAMMLSRGA